MDKRSILDELLRAKEDRFAIGAFNIFNYLSAKAVISAAQKEGCPVILQTSSQTAVTLGVKALGSMLRQLADSAQVTVFIHLDHCKDLELVKSCIDNGWDSVMYDGSALPIGENIRNSKTLAEYAHARGVFIEGELGKIAGVEDDISVSEDDAEKTSLDEAIRYAGESEVDMFAPAVGTAHGMYRGQPHINFSLIEQLKDRISQPIVIHGGTGLEDGAFLKLIESGAAKINVSTAIKHAYIDGAREYLQLYPDRLDPIGMDEFLYKKIESAAIKHIRLFRKD